MLFSCFAIGFYNSVVWGLLFCLIYLCFVLRCCFVVFNLWFGVVDYVGLICVAVCGC